MQRSIPLYKDDIAYNFDPSDKTTQDIIFMFAGLGIHAESLEPIAKFIANKTGKAVIVLHHKSYRQTLRQSVYFCENKIRQYRNHNYHGRMDLIGFSRGGHLATYIAGSQYGSTFTKHLITAGTPHLGTIFANHFWNNPNTLIRLMSRWAKGPSLQELQTNEIGQLNSNIFNKESFRISQELKIGLIAGTVPNPHEYKNPNEILYPQESIFHGEHDGTVSTESALGLPEADDQNKLTVSNTEHRHLEISTFVAEQICSFIMDNKFNSTLSPNIYNKTLVKEPLDSRIHPIGYPQVKSLLEKLASVRQRFKPGLV